MNLWIWYDAATMRRRLARFLVLGSTILFMLTVADWVYSTRNSETLVLIKGGHYYAIDNYSGEVSLWRGTILIPAKSPEGFVHVHWDGPNATKTWQFGIDNRAGSEWMFAGFVITNMRRIPTRTADLSYEDVYNVHGVAIPSWFLTLLFAILPARDASKQIRGRIRYGEGLCPQCGYDLRASRDRCPECGQPITSPPAASAAAIG
jgi:hypothetical protein